jgi:hypothetical protein
MNLILLYYDAIRRLMRSHSLKICIDYDEEGGARDFKSPFQMTAILCI